MIYLASSSPRRAELLRQIDAKFETLNIRIDESRQAAETAEQYVCRIAKAKAQAGSDQVRKSASDVAVLAADTIIALDGDIIGKPDNGSHCYHMLERLSGREHQVLTAIAVNYQARIHCQLSTSRVIFRDLEAAEIEAYCASGEPMDKAGGYAIQGRAAVFIKHLEGSYSSVMGLPIFETAEMLKQVGVKIGNLN